jgi:hypothetical protein
LLGQSGAETICTAAIFMADMVGLAPHRYTPDGPVGDVIENTLAEIFKPRGAHARILQSGRRAPR